MSSSEIDRKGVAQRGRLLERQPTGLPAPAGQTGSPTKRRKARRKPLKERSMRIPAIENDMLNRTGIPKKYKAMVRAASAKARRLSGPSPRKSLLAAIARKEVVVLEITEGGGNSGKIESGSRLVRCASPSPLPDSPTLSVSPQTPRLPATVTGAAEAKGKKLRVVLRPLPSRVAASSSHLAGSLPLSRTIPDAPTRSIRTRSSVASPSSRSARFSLLAVASRPNDAPPAGKPPTVPAPTTAVSDDSARSTTRPTKVQGEGVSTVLGVMSGEDSDSQSEASASDTTSHDVLAADVAQAAAVEQSLLSQIEGRNEEGRKWDDLPGFFHGLATGEIRGFLKTATLAGRRALRRFAGKDVADSDNSNDASIPGRELRSRRQGESMLAFDDARSDGEGEVMNQTIVPSRQRQFLYKAKGKARSRSPSPQLPSSPSTVSVSQTATATAAVSSSCASSCLSASAPSPAACKRSNSSESTSEHPTKRPKKKIDKSRALRREGAVSDLSAPPMPAQAGDQNDDDDDDAEPHVNLIKSFLLDIPGWLLRGGGPFAAARDDSDDGPGELTENCHGWMLRAELQGPHRQRQNSQVDNDGTA